MLKKYALERLDYANVVLDVDDANDALVSLLETAAKEKQIENLADAVGLSRPTLMAYISGNSAPRLETAMKIFNCLGFSLKVVPTETK